MAVKDLNIHNEFDMSYIDTGAVQPGKELVLIHGWCSNKFHWNPQIDFFKNSFRVIAMDLRGHGASFAPDDGYSFRNFASDINYLLDDLGVKHPIIFGHSMGGAIAIHLAAAFGSNARGLVMVDGSLNIAEQESNLESNERIRSFKQNDSSSEIADRYESFFSHMNDASLGKMIIKDAIKTPEHVAYASLLALYRDDVINVGKSITIPTLYIANAYSPRSSAEVKKFVPNSNFAQVVNAGHFLHLEDIEQANAMLNNFVNNI
tara:strand:- start:11423 stop:12208 length:786 start_codon:yes stop_codon:yes gene_type:complete